MPSTKSRARTAILRMAPEWAPPGRKQGDTNETFSRKRRAERGRFVPFLISMSEVTQISVSCARLRRPQPRRRPPTRPERAREPSQQGPPRTRKQRRRPPSRCSVIASPPSEARGRVRTYRVAARGARPDRGHVPAAFGPRPARGSRRGHEGPGGPVMRRKAGSAATAPAAGRAPAGSPQARTAGRTAPRPAPPARAASSSAPARRRG